MTTQLFLITEDDLNEIRGLSELLQALPQNRIDLESTRNSGGYGKLYHIRSLRLEETAVELEFGGLLSDHYLEILAMIDNAGAETSDGFNPAASVYTLSEKIQGASAWQDLARQIGVESHPDVLKKLDLYKESSERCVAILEVINPVDSCLFGLSEEVTVEPVFEEIPITSTRGDNKEESSFRVIRLGIQKALGGKIDSINLGVFSHIGVTNALRNFLYREPEKEPIWLPMAYSDGSEARTFPFLSLEPVECPDQLLTAPLISIGMVSDRHPEMDSLIDFYWFRNFVVSVNRATAETDEIAYQESKKLLAQAKTNGPLRIAFYQTGYEPAVIGFFRAVVEELLESRQTGNYWLEVTPYFYERKAESYRTGEVWF